MSFKQKIYFFYFRYFQIINELFLIMIASFYLFILWIFTNYLNALTGLIIYWPRLDPGISEFIFCLFRSINKVGMGLTM